MRKIKMRINKNDEANIILTNLLENMRLFVVFAKIKLINQS